MKQKNHIFTLIEMLVVIAIIGILAAMLMPALQNAISSTRDLNCANNHKQLGIGVQVYTNDYNGYMPYKEGHAHDIRNAADSPEEYMGHGKLKQLDYIADTRLFWCGNENVPQKQSGSENDYAGYVEFAKETTNHNCEVDIWYRYGLVPGYQEYPTEKISAIKKPSQTGLFMCAGVGKTNRVYWYQLHDGRGFNLQTIDGRVVWYDFRAHDPVNTWNSGAFYNCKKPKSALWHAVEMYNQ